MPNISKINIDGTLIDICDEYARNNIATLISEKNVNHVYDNVQDMQNSDISSYSVIMTKGFYSANDGGGAIYTVSNSETPNGFSILKCKRGYAKLLPKVANILQLGGIQDITDALTFAINNYEYIDIPYGNYTVSNITISKNLNKRTIINGNNSSITCTKGNISLTGIGADYNSEKITNLLIKDINLYNGGLMLSKCSHCTLFNVYVKSANKGISLNACTETYLIRCHCTGNNIGIEIVQNDKLVDNANNHLLYCSIDNNNVCDLYLNNFRDLHLIGCVIAGQQTAKRIEIESTISKNLLLSIDNCHIESNSNKIISGNNKNGLSTLAINNSLLLTTTEETIELTNIDTMDMQNNILSYTVTPIVKCNTYTKINTDDILKRYTIYANEPIEEIPNATINFYPNFKDRGNAEFARNASTTYNTDHIVFNASGILEFSNYVNNCKALVIASHVHNYNNFVHGNKIYTDPNGLKNYYLMSFTTNDVRLDFDANDKVYAIYLLGEHQTAIPILATTGDNPFKTGDIFTNADPNNKNGDLIVKTNSGWKNLAE